MEFDVLYTKAKAVLNPRRLSQEAEAGGVGAALLSDSGMIYTGVCIDTSSSMGFCAEHAAAAAMITAGENRVVKMLAVNWDGSILRPVGVAGNSSVSFMTRISMQKYLCARKRL